MSNSGELRIPDIKLLRSTSTLSDVESVVSNSSFTNPRRRFSLALSASLSSIVEHPPELNKYLHIQIFKSMESLVQLTSYPIEAQIWTDLSNHQVPPVMTVQDSYDLQMVSSILGPFIAANNATTLNFTTLITILCLKLEALIDVDHVG